MLAHGGELREIPAQYECDAGQCELARVCPELDFRVSQFFAYERITLYATSQSAQGDLLKGTRTILLKKQYTN